jgi:hypothetical protein
VTKETSNADPFEGFVSSAYKDGELVPPPAAPADAKGADGGGEEAGGVGKRDGVADVKADADPAAGADGEEAARPGGEAAAEGEKPEAAKEDGTKPEKKNKVSLEQRRAQIQREINDAVRARSDARRLAQEAFDAEMAALRSGKVATPQKDVLTEQTEAVKDDASGRPSPDKYKYGELDSQYITDLAELAADRKFAAKEAEVQKTRQAEAAAAEQRELATRAASVMEKGAEKYEDFQERVIDGAANNEWPLSKELGALIIDSEVGADIAYHLASNPDEARKVYGKSPMEQAAYFGRLEARFQSAPKQAATPEKPAPKVPKAEPPVKQPRGAGGKFGIDPSTSSFADFERLVDG